MGTYLNPGNSGFAEKSRKDYIDKTGLIRLINDTIDTNDKLTCVSRPRRFGKSFAAQMLCAYYDKTCDSSDLFSHFLISQDSSYPVHLNQYDVIYIDMTNLLGKVSPEDLCGFIAENVEDEITTQYPQVQRGTSLDQTLIHTVEHTGNKFIVIIDEWDAPIRETPEIEAEYLRFLRMLFKSSGTTPRIFAAAYMTGILPIKKDGSQSAISDFREYSMMEPAAFAPYTGFTEGEVQELCLQRNLPFASMQKWYDGYSVGSEQSVYNPFSVMRAASAGKFKSYWKKTSAAEALMTYIDLDEDGLQSDIVKLIAGESIEVDPDGFQNDLSSFATKDDVLTLLIHLGYLAYEEIYEGYGEEEDTRPVGYARIPNEEIRIEFEQILRRAKHRDLIALVRKSDQLLDDTIHGRQQEVAKAIADIHESGYGPTWYNDEQALRYVIRFAYISSVDQYARVEEMPAGHGIADVVFIPKRRSALPAMIIELKWNKSAEAAIGQARDRNYPKALAGYGGPVLLVGINYDAVTKEHTCRIETVDG